MNQLQQYYSKFLQAHTKKKKIIIHYFGCLERKIFFIVVVLA